MKKYSLIFAAAITLMATAACDEGDIREKDVTYALGGYTVKMNGRLTGIGEWGDGLSVVLAAFDGQERVYDMGEMRITDDCEGRDTTLVWTGVNRSAQSVELCIVNRLRRRMATLAVLDLDENADTVNLDVGAMNVGLFGAVQGLLNQRCTGCHGGGDYANLKLDAEHSYSQLVGVTAYRDEFRGAARVQPGDAQASALYQMLDPDDEHGRNVLMFQHKAAYVEDEMSQGYALSLIGRWIDAGARP